MIGLPSVLLLALEAAVPAVLVLDFSTSMIADAAGRPRLERLRSAAAGLTMPPTAGELGIVAFGHRQDDACDDVEVLRRPGRPEGPQENAELARRLGQIQARGKAPMATALAEAVRLLPRSGPGLLVLAIDGEDNCGGNLEAAVAAALKTHPQLRIRFLGLGLGREELRRLAGGALARLEPVAAAADYAAALGRALDPNRQRALLYVLSNGTDSRGWYRQPSDLEPLQTLCASLGIDLEIRDRRSLPRLTQKALADFEQIWILEADHDDRLQATPAEAELLFSYWSEGGGIWVSLESVAPTGVWAEDADALLEPFGIGFGGNVESFGGPKPVAGSHPLLSEVRTLYLDDQYAFLRWDPDGAAEPVYGAGGQPVILALDGRAERRGRLVADGGWILGWLIGRRRAGRDETARSDNLQFLQNSASWLGR